MFYWVSPTVPRRRRQVAPDGDGVRRVDQTVQIIPKPSC
ncbi:hypothetical protein Pd630_LPD07376 [Rhodococcus opacus PD630]|nr:hypothetical protein Pd630_LPD07376 [Rhodococcus opacus PD630]